MALLCKSCKCICYLTFFATVSCTGDKRVSSPVPLREGGSCGKKTLIAFTGMFLVCCLWAVCAALVIRSYMLALPVASVRAFKIVFLKKLAHRGCG